MPERRLPIISLFSGAMGLDLGLETAGLQPTIAVEIDEFCCASMRGNRPDLDVWETDVASIDGKLLLERIAKPKDVFLMVGGPPCQSFCPGGKRAGLSDPRGNLIYTYLRLIKEIRPQFFVFENVANIVTAALRHRPIERRPGKHWNLSLYTSKARRGGDEAPAMEPDELSGSAIRQIVADVGKLGYQIRMSVADAADYGAAQHRLRFIMIGARDFNAPSLPRPTHGERSIEQKCYRTVRDAIFDLRHNPGPHSVYTDGVRKFFELVPPGGNWRSLSRDHQVEALGEGATNAGGGRTGFYRRLSWDLPAPTITGRANRKGSALCHPEFIRPLSVRECARIQGFADDWIFCGSMNRQYQQVGNAVPVELGEAIGKAILSGTKTRGKSAQSFDDLDRALLEATQRLRASARNKRKKNKEQLDLF